MDYGVDSGRIPVDSGKILVNLQTLLCRHAEFTFIGQWWSGSDCIMFCETEEVYKLVGKEHTIVLMNHKYDIDWMMAWILAERLSMLGVCSGSATSQRYHLKTAVSRPIVEFDGIESLFLLVNSRRFGNGRFGSAFLARNLRNIF